MFCIIVTQRWIRGPMFTLMSVKSLIRQDETITYSSAFFWSCSSYTPSLFWIRCSRLVPWKPLPRPSQRTTMAPKLLTSTVAQSMWNCSATVWPPGVPSLHTHISNQYYQVKYNDFFSLIAKFKWNHCIEIMSLYLFGTLWVHSICLKIAFQSYFMFLGMYYLLGVSVSWQ